MAKKRNPLYMGLNPTVSDEDARTAFKKKYNRKASTIKRYRSIVLIGPIKEGEK